MQGAGCMLGLHDSSCFHDCECFWFVMEMFVDSQALHRFSYLHTVAMCMYLFVCFFDFEVCTFEGIDAYNVKEKLLKSFSFLFFFFLLFR